MQSRGLPMKRYLISIFLALAVQICYANEWKWKADTGNDGVVLIGASREGFETFSEAVDSVEKELWIQYIRLSTLFHHPQLQNEIHEYMKRNYPKELKEALHSAGNMHNPKVLILHKAFKEAILNSSYVKALNDAFLHRCERISSVSIEKFYIVKRNPQPYYDAMVWLTTEKCSPTRASN